MAEPTAPEPSTESAPPPPSANGTAPSPPAAASRRPRLRTRISSARNALIAGCAVLIVMLIFIIQNTRAVQISFLGAHASVSLAVALLLAAIAGALLPIAVGTARITQLRRVIRRDRRRGPPRP
jgi:lipopolysaccharide assembly protein A